MLAWHRVAVRHKQTKCKSQVLWVLVQSSPARHTFIGWRHALPFLVTCYQGIACHVDMCTVETATAHHDHLVLILFQHFSIANNQPVVATMQCCLSCALQHRRFILTLSAIHQSCSVLAQLFQQLAVFCCTGVCCYSSLHLYLTVLEQPEGVRACSHVCFFSTGSTSLLPNSHAGLYCNCNVDAHAVPAACIKSTEGSEYNVTAMLHNACSAVHNMCLVD